jgi:hypothetical protein
MVSGGKDAFEKSLMGSNSVEFSQDVWAVQPLQAVLSMQAGAAIRHWIADPEPDKAFHRFPHRPRRYECGRFEHHSAERDLTSSI